LSLQLVTTAEIDNTPKLHLVDPPFEPQRFEVQGVAVSAMSFDEAVEMLCKAPLQGRKLRVHFAAVHTMVEAAKSEAMHHCLATAEVIAPDGVPLVWYGRRKGFAMQRVCGPDTMPAVLERSRWEGTKHFFYGGAPGVAEQLVENMTQRYPGLQVAGIYCPPFRALTERETGDVVEMIDASGADFVWVGLGSPKQDLWMQEMQPRLQASVLLGVGAAFDFHAGLKARAPRWMQRTGLEWTHRLISEPRRLAGRYLTQATWLMRLVITDGLRRKHADRVPQTQQVQEPLTPG
jgi:N-acetylglucosaminyldiphosphoundecaprenol N-acetyl-beta-D-mannosaminyltransferase